MTLVYLFVGVLVIAAVVIGVDTVRHPTPKDLSDEHVLNELKRGDRILAIRWHRTLHGGGLKQASREVDELARLHGIEIRK